MVFASYRTCIEISGKNYITTYLVADCCDVAKALGMKFKILGHEKTFVFSNYFSIYRFL